MKRPIAIVGCRSVLAREFARRNAELDLRLLTHDEWYRVREVEGLSCIVNFGFAPQLETGPYAQALDLDSKLAGCIVGSAARYVMISSRRVYAPAAQWNASEKAEASGLDVYGRNKARIERVLATQLGERLTILRPGNVLAYEPVPGRRRFGAYLQAQLLASGNLHLTIPARARRDLVPVDFFCDVLRAVVTGKTSGVLNVGTGRATRAADAARWLAEGFGAAVTCAPAVAGPLDEFQLDVRKLGDTLGLRCEHGAVERFLRETGSRLGRESSALLP